MDTENDSDFYGLVGHVIDARYRVDCVVGEGGFGVVYKGYHLAFEIPVAIKVLKVPSHFTSEGRRIFLERFRQEGRLLSRLAQCVGTVRVFDFGTIGGSSNAPYLVIEWLHGRTLAAVIRDRNSRQLPLFGAEEAIRLLLPVVHALAVAHTAGFAHRDVKPENLILVDDTPGLMKLIDFGIAKAMYDADLATQAGPTSSGFQAFSPSHGAPEQFAPNLFGETGPWTDVHALGLVLVEMITGRAALSGNNRAELSVAATSSKRPTPRVLGASVSDEVERTASAMLSVDPRDRPRDALELLSILTPLVVHNTSVSTQAGAFSHASPRLLHGQPAGPPLMPLEPVDTTARRLPSRRRLFSVLLATAILVGGIYSIWFGFTLTIPNDEAPPPIPTGSQYQSPIATGERYYYYRNFELYNLDKGGQLQLSEDEARGTRHYLAVWQDDRLVGVRKISPSGRVIQSTSISYHPDGTAVLESRDGYEQVLRTEYLSPSGRFWSNGRDGNPLTAGCTLWELQRGADSLVAARHCKNRDGSDARNSEGCFAIRTGRSPAGFIEQEECLDLNNNITLFSGAYNRRLFSYDERGYLTAIRYESSDGQPMSNADGCTGVLMKRDKAGNEIETMCVDGSGGPVRTNDDLPPVTVRIYDENGCTTKTRWFDAGGSRAAHPNGAWEQVFRVDERCSILQQEARTIQNEVARISGEPSRVEYVRDLAGRIISQRCYGRAKPVSCLSAEAGVSGSVRRFSYDSQGRMTVSKAFSDTGATTGHSSYFPHEFRTAYSEEGLSLSLSYFDENGKPTTAFGGVHRISFAYNEQRQSTSQKYWDRSNSAVVASTSCHELRTNYDDDFQRVSIECRDPKGELHNAFLRLDGIDWPRGAARVTIVRTPQLQNVYTSASGETMKRVNCTKNQCYR